MSENTFSNYLEGEYDGKTGVEYGGQLIVDMAKASMIMHQVEMKQTEAEENEKKRISAQYEVTGEELDKLYNTYVGEDKLGEYLVDGAVLRCNQATPADFELPNGEKVILEKAAGKGGDECCYITLNVSENPMSGNDLMYGTVKDTVLNENIIPPECNCKLGVNRNAEMEKIMADSDRNKHGVCRHLIRLNEEWDNMIIEGRSYMTKTDVKPLGSDQKNAERVEGITMTSVLFCKHGGLITPVSSGQKTFEAPVSGISKKGLRALMALEILDEVGKQYLVINDDNILIGIKPHLAGDSRVTVGFGDCLLEGDLEFYLDESRRNRIAGYLSDQVKDYDAMKDTVIPVDICFEKLLLDVEPLCQSVFKQFPKTGIILSQEQFDAIVIAKYQCFALGDKAFKAIKNGEDRKNLYKAFLDAHGENGDFHSRTNVEMNIYFGDGYEVEGELTDVIVEPMEEMYGK
ncbi:MAG: hypothetical protein K2N15_05345 [Lachnospiraceae bacterium]|nr:hypothetical protein [Lachnospiraceae bacterium]